MEQVELRIDVTDTAELGQEAWIALTVHLPDPAALPAEPVVCFAKPGGGYSRRYFTVDLPGPARGVQAAWHAGRGWVFVSVDHLGVGDSSTDHEPGRLDYTTLAATQQAAEQEVLDRLARGTLVDGFPAVTAPVRIGIGQSMGGCMTIIQQGRHHCYDGIGIFGYGAVHTHPPVAPELPPLAAPWIPRDTLLREPLVVLNTPQLAAAAWVASTDTWAAMRWGFHWDDVDDATVAADMERGDTLPPWASATFPGAVAATCLTPGAVLPEASAVIVPVLVGVGERDTAVDPRGDVRAYRSARSVDFFTCPRMGHMHNFASTRELLWQRLETWATWVTAARSSPVWGAGVG